MVKSKTENKGAKIKKSGPKKRKGDFSRKTTETDIKLSLNLDGKGIYDIDTGVPFFNHMLEQFSKHSRFDMTLEAKGDIGVDFHHLIEDAGIVIGAALRELSGDKKGIKRFGFASIPMDEALVQAKAEACVQTSVDFCGRAFFVYNKDSYNKTSERAKEKSRNKRSEGAVTLILKAMKRDKETIDNILKLNKNNKSITRDKLIQGIDEAIAGYADIIAEKFFYDYANIFFDALSKNALMTLHINVMYGSNKHHIVEAIFKSAGIAVSDALKIEGGRGIPSTKGRI